MRREKRSQEQRRAVVEDLEFTWRTLATSGRWMPAEQAVFFRLATASQVAMEIADVLHAPSRVAIDPSLRPPPGVLGKLRKLTTYVTGIADLTDARVMQRELEESGGAWLSRLIGDALRPNVFGDGQVLCVSIWEGGYDSFLAERPGAKPDPAPAPPEATEHDMAPPVAALIAACVDWRDVRATIASHRTEVSESEHRSLLLAEIAIEGALLSLGQHMAARRDG